MEKSVEISITLQAPPAKVWLALTTPEIIKKYFFGTLVKTDWRVGSPISFEGEYQGKRYEDKGQILQCTPLARLSYSYWSVFSNLPDQPEHYQIITYELSPGSPHTQLTVLQENLKEETQTHKDQIKGHWTFVLGGLKKLVEVS